MQTKRTWGTRRTPWQERFWRYVTPGAPDECWEWEGARTTNGYGTLGGDKQKRHLRAHRASWEIHFGPIPEGTGHHGTVVCHHCDNKLCVNPAHLFLGSQKDNLRDMMRKGRGGGQLTSERVQRYSDAQVREMRMLAAAGVTYPEIAERFGSTRQYVCAIARGTNRRPAGGPIVRQREIGLRTWVPEVVEVLETQEREDRGVS